MTDTGHVGGSFIRPPFRYWQELGKLYSSIVFPAPRSAKSTMKATLLLLVAVAATAVALPVQWYSLQKSTAVQPKTLTDFSKQAAHYWLIIIVPAILKKLL